MTTGSNGQASRPMEPLLALQAGSNGAEPYIGLSGPCCRRSVRGAAANLEPRCYDGAVGNTGCIGAALLSSPVEKSPPPCRSEAVFGGPVRSGGLHRPKSGVLGAAEAGTAGHSAADRPSLIPSWLQTRSAPALPWVALALDAVGRRTVRQPVQNRRCDDRVAKDPPSSHPLSGVRMTVPLVEPAITQAVKIAGRTRRNVEEARSSMATALGTGSTLAFVVSRAFRPA
jgi:hypothetical protein